MRRLIIFLISCAFTSATLLGQEETEIRVSQKGIYRKSFELSRKDSVMIDSVKNLISQVEKLNKTLRSLNDSLYSQNLKRYVYRIYTQHLNENTDFGLDFLLVHGLKEGLYVPMNHHNGYIEPEYLSDPIYSTVLKRELAISYIKEKVLYDCRFFEFSGIPYYFDFNYKIERPTIDKTLYYDSIGKILAEGIEEIKELNEIEDRCFNKNIEILLEYSPSFKKAYFSN